MSDLEYKNYYRRNLPHFQPENAKFFVTYRLAFTLPKHIIESYNLDRTNLDFEEYLDKCNDSPKWLLDDEIANNIINSWKFYHNIKYKLFCMTVMPNHVHVIFEPLQKDKYPYSIAEIMKGTKNFSALSANKTLKRKGQFWAHENYDHAIRDSEELNFYIEYILYNPVKAKLVNEYKNWKFFWINEELANMRY